MPSAVSIDGKAKITNQAATKKYGESPPTTEGQIQPTDYPGGQNQVKGRPAGRVVAQVGIGHHAQSMPIVFHVLLTRVL